MARRRWSTRGLPGKGAIRRRRECLLCAQRFTTFERIEETPLFVVKRDGTRQPFERSKLLAGLVRACTKRPVSIEQIERAAATIEAGLRNGVRDEVPSQAIGDEALAVLRDLDRSHTSASPRSTAISRTSRSSSRSWPGWRSRGRTRVKRRTPVRLSNTDEDDGQEETRMATTENPAETRVLEGTGGRLRSAWHRYFTHEGVDPYDAVEWENRTR